MLLIIIKSLFYLYTYIIESNMGLNLWMSILYNCCVITSSFLSAKKNRL